MEIPDRPFTFGTLISAQAAGDAGVMAERGRPVLRLHLTDPAAGVQQLISLFQKHRQIGGKRRMTAEFDEGRPAR